jgi:hypothetical protein
VQRGQGDDDLDGALGLGGEEEDVFPDEAELDRAEGVRIAGGASRRKCACFAIVESWPRSLPILVTSWATIRCSRCLASTAAWTL